MNDKDIYTTDAVPGDVHIQLSYPTRTGPDLDDADRNIASLVITDKTSRQILASVDLNAAQYLSMMSSTGTDVSGAGLPARPELIGLRRQNTSTAVPYSYGTGPGDAKLRLDEVVADYQASGWETEVRRSNGGHQVIAYRYIDADGNPVQIR